jgi:hypothetical protein
MQVAPEAPARPEQALPETPPAQLERKSRRGRWIVAAIIAGVIGIAAANSGQTQTAAPTAPTAPKTQQTTAVTAEAVADAFVVMHPNAPAKIRQAVALLGYDRALAEFTKGYGASQTPSAQNVFDQLMSR